MRKWLLLHCMMIAVCLKAQQVHHFQVDKFELGNSASVEKRVIVQMPFGKSTITRVEGDTAALDSAHSIIIDLVYTDFGQPAELEVLNRKRVQQLYSHFRSLHKGNVEQINYYRQLDQHNKTVAQEMFHGIVIRFVVPQSRETIKRDVEMMKTIMDCAEELAKLPAATSDYTDTVIYKPDTVALRIFMKAVLIKGIKDWAGKTIDSTKVIDTITKFDSTAEMPMSVARRLGYVTDSDVQRWYSVRKVIVYFKRIQQAELSFHTVRISKFDWVKSRRMELMERCKGMISDSTVFKPFTRNKWSKYVVVADVTGSMSPYMAQLLMWLKLQTVDSAKAFTFFNDGDDKLDVQKVIGSTGGIYSGECHGYKEVEQLLTATMLKGNGGDLPENNIEAIIEAQKKFPNAEQIVMIADNWAPIKDTSLIAKVTRPVRIILCGVTNHNFHPSYLMLANKTGGSLHTVEDDITSLAKLHEGDTLVVGGRKWRLSMGQWIEIFSD